MAVSVLRSAILDGRFGPGQRLIESELTHLLGLGRGPVREALKRLAVEGIVSIEHNRGATVSRASRNAMAQTFDVREYLEGLAARRAAERVMHSPHRAVLERALEEEATRDAYGDAVTFMEVNENLHSAIVAASENEVIARMLNQLNIPVLRGVFFKIMSPAIWRTSANDHIEILSRILKADADRAETAMRDHVRKTHEMVLRLPDSYFS